MASILVDYPIALSDRPSAMRLKGFRPQQAIEVCATGTDLSNRRWRSLARFIADGSGRVDLRTQAPRSGTYQGAAPIGLFWSMELLVDQEPKEPWRRVMDGISRSAAAPRRMPMRPPIPGRRYWRS